VNLLERMYGLIVAGGSGTRLWPLSRANNPKQLLSLDGEGASLLQATFRRLLRTIPAERILTVTNRAYGGQVLRQLQAIRPVYPPANVMAEPVGRNSAGAILWGALRVAARRPDALMVVVWSDHLIRNDGAFDRSLIRSAEAADSGSLVALGVRPTRPDTGLGYIEAGPSVGEGVYEALRFVEKPDRATAERFLSQGRYSWNAGMFVFPVNTLLEEFARHAPALPACFQRHGPAGADNDWSDPAVISAVYGELPEGSIDHLVLEKTKRLRVVPAELDWSDLGSWDVVYGNSPKDEQGNAISGNVLALGTRNSLIRGSNRLVTALGVENLIVVDTEDALLICDMSKVQDVKKLVAVLAERGVPEVKDPPTVTRPWGNFTVVAKGPGYQLKVIEVLPNQRMSLQYHHQRDEHWIVMEGTARVVLGDEARDLIQNEHARIPRGLVHRMGNTSERMLRVMELQQGDYLGEDDIVRLEDQYGRV
jgi:mannose-1-phosphate guanylyltransferase/mannose-6-phosphate isomerase